jgi:molybdenum-dependent DNA-binding transcriptional regulator ModE
MNERVDAPMAEIAVFVAVAQTGSFTRAAEDLGSSKSNVGKAVQRLETRLGTKLFQRTTRSVRLHRTRWRACAKPNSSLPQGARSQPGGSR